MGALSVSRDMPRPTSRGDAVLDAAARSLMPSYAAWCQEEECEELVVALKAAMQFSSDGYEIASQLERGCYISPDQELVEALSSASSHVYDAKKKCVADWVKYVNAILPLSVGDRVTCHHGQGVIVKVDAEQAQYGVRTPDQRESSYWILNAEDVTVIQTAEAV